MVHLRRLGRAGVTVIAAAIVSVAAVTPASATGQASVYDRQAEAGRVNYFRTGPNHYYFDFRVSDTQCDGHSVYAQYQRAGASRRTLPNSGGCGTHSDYWRHFTTGQSIKYRVCVDKPFYIGDVCGRWKWDTTGG